jgi:SAM-dependent methyltransferase
MQSLTRRDYWDAVHVSEGDQAARPRETASRPRWKSALRRLVGRRFLEYTSSYDDHQLWSVFYPSHLPGPGASVVEIGSAPGEHLARLQREFGLVPYGIEYSPSGVRVNREVFAAHGLDPRNVVEVDFFSRECLEAHRERFDVVISRGFIEHFSDAACVVDRHLALLKPGGVLIITIPNLRGVNRALCQLFHRETIPMHNLAIMSKPAFLGLFDPAKVRAVRCDYFGTFSFCLFNTRAGSWLAPLLAACARLQPLLNVLFRACFGARGGECRFTSPQLIFAGVKR